MLLSNHPQLAGGSHLPDITVMTPVFDHGEVRIQSSTDGVNPVIRGWRQLPKIPMPQRSCTCVYGY